RALALDPRDPALLHAWGAALYRRGDLSGAIRAMKASLALFPGQARVHHNLARVLEKAGFPDEAQEHDRMAESLDPALSARTNGEPPFSGGGL
ncbi:MAG: tetratricopeptide repeat protein, partial [Pseudomonadota bacterium]